MNAEIKTGALDEAELEGVNGGRGAFMPIPMPRRPASETADSTGGKDDQTGGLARLWNLFK
jgi:hypothetical protein